MQSIPADAASPHSAAADGVKSNHAARLGFGVWDLEPVISAHATITSDALALVRCNSDGRSLRTRLSAVRSKLALLDCTHAVDRCNLVFWRKFTPPLAAEFIARI